MAHENITKFSFYFKLHQIVLLITIIIMIVVIVYCSVVKKPISVQYVNINRIYIYIYMCVLKL